MVLCKALFFLPQLSIAQDPRTPEQNLKGTVCEVKRLLLHGRQSKKFLAVKVEIQNNSLQTYLLDGDNAKEILISNKASKRGLSCQAVSNKQVIKISSAQYTPISACVLFAISVGSLGLAAPVAAEVISSYQGWAKKLGSDEIRHEVEDERLGLRILLPQEIGTGTIYFPCRSGIPQRVSIPFLSYPEAKPLGQIIIDIANQG